MRRRRRKSPATKHVRVKRVGKGLRQGRPQQLQQLQQQPQPATEEGRLEEGVQKKAEAPTVVAWRVREQMDQARPPQQGADRRAQDPAIRTRPTTEGATARAGAGTKAVRSPVERVLREAQRKSRSV